jgi:cation transport regulator ChaC
VTRVAAWARRAWQIATDPRGAAESDALVASLVGSAVKAGLVYCVVHPDVPAVTTVRVGGHTLAVCSGCLDLAGSEWGWAA